jgi:hypothetical protein
LNLSPVVSGTNLVAKDAGGTSDPYVKVGFFDSKKNEMFKASGTKDSFKTDVVKKSLGPNWNYKGELQVGPMVVQNCKDIAFMVYVREIFLLELKIFSLLYCEVLSLPLFSFRSYFLLGLRRSWRA